MDKQAIEDLAVDIADDMGYDYFDVSPKLRAKIYKIAMDDFSDMMADKADMMRKNEAAGGMMRANYAMGSEDDIPEQEDMSPEEFEDIKKMIGAPTDQASGIMSIDNKMASEPSRKADADSIARELFGKGIDELDEVEIIQLQEYLDRLASKRKAPSIKMAEYEPGNYDPLIVDEYEKYKFDAEEQGQPVMSIDEFLQMARSQAMNGGMMRNKYAFGTPMEESYPIKKQGDKIDLDVAKIEQLVDQRKKEKKKLAKGGIAGVL